MSPLRPSAGMRALLVPTATVLLGVVLLAMWTTASGRFMVDEGSVVLQAKTLAEDGGWFVDHALEDVDPDGTAFPLRTAERGEQGWAPYAKHPLYPAILSVAHRAGGVAGQVGVSVLAVTLASLASGLLAEQLRKGLGRPTVVATGLASPLFFDGLLVIAHALGAAAAAVAAWSMVRSVQSHGWPRIGWVVTGGTGVALLVMVRTEGLLLVAAGVAVTLAYASWKRSRSALTVASVAGVAALGGWTASREWRQQIVHAAPSFVEQSAGSVSSSSSFAADRWHALTLTSARVSYAGDAARMLLPVSVVALIALVILLWRSSPSRRALRGYAIVSALAAVLWASTAQLSPVPGFLVACPLIWLGWFVPGGNRNGLPRILLATFVVFAALVAASQYRQGGGIEWGARYVAIGIPIVVPVSIAGWDRARTQVDRQTWRILVASLTLVSLSLVSMGSRTVRDATEATRSFEQALISIAPDSSVGAADYDGRPVIVSGEFAYPQLTSSIFDDARWLRLRDDRPIATESVDRRISALIRAGVDRFSYLTRDLDRDRPLLGSDVLLDPLGRVEGLEIVLVRPDR